LSGIKVEGFVLPKDLLEVNKQPEVGEEGFEAGAKILSDFFKRELPKFDSPALEPLGRQIIECCMSDGSVKDYVKLIPIRL
jgi:hypothetical protein